MKLYLLPLLLLVCCLTACGAEGGILGAGGTWQAGPLQKQHLQVLAVDPNHLQDIYAGDAQDGIFVSTNTGLTWQQSNTGLPLPVNVRTLSFDFTGKKLYAGTSKGLFISDNLARSWNLITHVPMDVYTSLTFDVNSLHVVYAGSAGHGLFKSADDGLTWTNLTEGLPDGRGVTSLLYDPNLKQLWASFTDGLYRSDNGGVSWHLMNGTLPANVGINILALGALANDQELIFAATDHGFFITKDDGKVWQQSQTSLAKLRIFSALLDATQPDVVYISTRIGVLRSQDNGQNWDQVAAGLPVGQTPDGLVQAGNSYAQLLVASHGVYLYPGSSGSITDPSRLLPILLVLLFFFLLYRFVLKPRHRPRQPVAESSRPLDHEI